MYLDYGSHMPIARWTEPKVCLLINNINYKLPHLFPILDIV